MVPYFSGRPNQIIKNHFYNLIKRNLRVFNQRVPKESKLKGEAKYLVKIPEFRGILFGNDIMSFPKMIKTSTDSSEDKSDSSLSISSPEPFVMNYDIDKKLDILRGEMLLVKNEINKTQDLIIDQSDESLKKIKLYFDSSKQYKPENHDSYDKFDQLKDEILTVKREIYKTQEIIVNKNQDTVSQMKGYIDQALGNMEKRILEKFARN